MVLSGMLCLPDMIVHCDSLINLHPTGIWSLYQGRYEPCSKLSPTVGYIAVCSCEGRSEVTNFDTRDCGCDTTHCTPSPVFFLQPSGSSKFNPVILRSYPPSSVFSSVYWHWAEGITLRASLTAIAFVKLHTACLPTLREPRIGTCSTSNLQRLRSRSSSHAPSILYAYDASAAFSKPLRSILFGLSIGRPSARSQISCASGPRPLLTPKMAV